VVLKIRVAPQKTASAVCALVLFIAMGASAFAIRRVDAATHTQSTADYPLATYIVNKAPRELSSPSARPTFKATVSGKRKTLLC